MTEPSYLPPNGVLVLSQLSQALSVIVFCSSHHVLSILFVSFHVYLGLQLPCWFLWLSLEVFISSGNLSFRLLWYSFFMEYGMPTRHLLDMYGRLIDYSLL